MKHFFLSILSILSFSISNSQWLKADGKKIVNENGDEVILRGYGPGGWQIMEGYMMQTSGFAGSQHEIRDNLIDLMGETKTEEFFQSWRRDHFTKRDVDSLASWGFNSIRIPMHYNLFTLPIEMEPVQGENTWIETGFELIDDVLSWAEPHNMYVILDMHATPGGQGAGSEINDYDPSKPSLWESEANRDKLVQLWIRIANRYKDNQWIGGYDLINETHWDLGDSNGLLREIYELITEGIRGSGDNHIIFIEGNSYANDHRGLTPPWDDNLVYSFHKYWSFNNSNDLDWILPLRDNYNVPLWMGEAGENSNTWFTDAVKLFENNNIGWAWWALRKIGDIDSPYAIKINPGYQKIIDYWKGEGPRPSEEEAYHGMMQLVSDLSVENSLFRKDVPDALIRQVKNDVTLPFNGSPTSIPGVLYVSDFDLGKIGMAYYDTNAADYNLSTGSFQAWNSGWSYRNDGVDIESNNEVELSNGYNIGFVDFGEWTKYTVNVEEDGLYSLNFRVASQESGGKFHLSINGQGITSIQTINSTGGWTNYNSLYLPNVVIRSGIQDLKLHFDSDIPFNITGIEFVREGDIGEIELKALTGETDDDERSINLTLNDILLSDLELNESEFSQFQVFVNGENREVHSISVHPTLDRTLKISLKDYLLENDNIVLSYNGSSIASKAGKLLENFSNLSIINYSPSRFVLPGILESENYDELYGMGTEDCSDVGGGKNLNYTDEGDYADYDIYVPDNGLYSVEFRIAGFDVGRIGLYLIDNESVEEELILVDTKITGGWQNWESIQDNIYLTSGIHRLRMRILSGGFNINWLKFGEPDSDSDGVIDSIDQCPNTPNNTTVDIHGCPVFQVPIENYIIKIFDETCRDNDDGSIVINTLEEFEYSVTITGNDLNETNSFSSNIIYNDLPSGTYKLCFRISESTEYEQCFSLNINQPDELIVIAQGLDTDRRKVTLNLSGSDRFYIHHNDRTITTSRNSISLDLNEGVNSISVSTDIDCQGIYEEFIIVSKRPVIFPNPITNILNIRTTDHPSQEAIIKVYSLLGELRLTRKIKLEDLITLDLSNLDKGLYILKMELSNEFFSYKIIKE